MLCKYGHDFNVYDWEGKAKSIVDKENQDPNIVATKKAKQAINIKQVMKVQVNTLVVNIMATLSNL
jgi:hypothetical protein